MNAEAKNIPPSVAREKNNPRPSFLSKTPKAWKNSLSSFSASTEGSEDFISEDFIMVIIDHNKEFFITKPSFL